MPSFYCPDLDNIKATLTITGDEFHHLSHVLRHKKGDEIKLNSGKGWLGTGFIDSINKSDAVIQVVGTTFSEPPSVPFALAFSLLRNKNDEWLVEKATELGVTDLFPIRSDNSVRNPSLNTLNRFRQTSVSAIKQCNNPYLPVIHDVLRVDKLLSILKQKGYRVVTASEERPGLWIDNLEKGFPYCFVIGPEGGFSPEEFKIMRKEGILEISLSKRILRAETAAIAAAAQISLLNK
jgi:16S rRNA (uracil1498-N3)-methyltransferase